MKGDKMNRSVLKAGTLVLLGMLLVLMSAGFANAATSYTVQNGDSLFFIAQKYGVTVNALKAANGISGDQIYQGQHLTIPGSTGNGARYTVVSGDTLFLISQRFGVSSDTIRRANNIWKDVVYPGQVLYIPGARTAVAMTASNGLSRSDTNLLARVVYAEARGEVYQGQVAVAAVILNRLKNPNFPKSIPGIIYEPWAFTSVDDGQINLTPDAAAYKAVQDALNGWDPTYGAVYYWNPATATSQWVWSRPITTRIGNHVFAK